MRHPIERLYWQAKHAYLVVLMSEFLLYVCVVYVSEEHCTNRNTCMWFQLCMRKITYIHLAKCVAFILVRRYIEHTAM